MSIRNYTVGDLMSTALITVHPDDLIAAADLEMKLARIRHLPVVDERNKLVGILSDRDLLGALVKRRRASIIVREVMTRAPYTVRDNESASVAVEVMLSEKIGALPVEGENGQLVGVLTETDLLRLLLDPEGRELREVV